jgi:hypothetical protein
LQHQQPPPPPPPHPQATMHQVHYSSQYLSIL